MLREIKNLQVGDLARWVGTISGPNDTRLNHYILIKKIDFQNRWIEGMYLTTGTGDDSFRKAGTIVVWYFKDYKRHKERNRRKQNWYWEVVK